MKWNKVKDKLPPNNILLVVYRYHKEAYIISMYVGNEWHAQSGWYHDIGLLDEWMVLPNRKS